MSPARVAIAGAGIGGLTLAAALRRRGVDVVVLERATAPGPAGAGITVQPNAMTALRRIGVDQAVAAEGALIREVALVDTRGRSLGPPIDAGALAAELGAPPIALHRARLHRVLRAAAGTVRDGAVVAGFDDGPTAVTVRLADGTTIGADLLVGADGVRSAVRAQLVGDGEPTYAGYTSWRGIAPAASLASSTRATEAWGRGERFGIVPIGHGEIYWLATANAPPGGHDDDLRASLDARFGTWHAPIPALLAATPVASILRTDIADRPPLRAWYRGRVVLLGDAAHPMTPNLGQGGCQAIEDAIVLDECLAARSELTEALAAYQARRQPRATDVVRSSRRLGAIAQWQHPLACWLRNVAVRATPAAVALRQVRALQTYPG